MFLAFKMGSLISKFCLVAEIELLPQRHVFCHFHPLIRDLIDLINKDDSEGALIFLDQEKAFDRVEHDFLFKTMAAFGFGDAFIDWIRVLYSNATTRVKVNGHYTNSIPLKRGLRQGPP